MNSSTVDVVSAVWRLDMIVIDTTNTSSGHAMSRSRPSPGGVPPGEHVEPRPLEGGCGERRAECVGERREGDEVVQRAGPIRAVR